MDFKICIKKQHSILMEGALGERLKREYHLNFDKHVAMAKLIYDSNGRFALKSLWQGYMNIAMKYQLPFMATTPTRRANKERIEQAGCNSSIIIDNVKFLRKIQQESTLEMYVGGLIGCKGDAYTGEDALSKNEARAFHKWQADYEQTALSSLHPGLRIMFIQNKPKGYPLGLLYIREYLEFIK